MSTLLVAVIVVGAIAIICFLLVGIHNKNKREAMNNLLDHFRRLGSENGLSFSSQEVLQNSVLGLDGVQRKILVLSKDEDSFSWFTIDLSLVKSCRMKKVYGTIKAGSLKTQNLERYLEKILLHFEIENHPPVEIAFYENSRDAANETQKLEQKAKYWETILSKMQTPVKSIA